MTLRRTEISRMSAKQRAKRAADGEKHPVSTLKCGRKPLKAKASPTNPDAALVDAVLEREGWCCGNCGGELHGRRGIEYSIHHRKRRSQGGDNRPSNLVALCGHGTSGCHGDVHRLVAAATKAGLLVPRDVDPEAVPLDHFLHGHGHLLNDGSFRRAVPSLEGAVE